jgi:hypothetical protein
MLVPVLVASAIGLALMAKRRAKNTPGSPGKRKPKDQIRISGSRQLRKVTYHIKCEALQPNLEVYFIQVHASQDAYMNHWLKAIDEDSSWKDLGFLLHSRRRRSVHNDEFWVNDRDGFARKVAIRDCGDEPSTHEERMRIMHMIREFCMEPKNNRYNYEYIVDDSSDLTPDNVEDYSRPDAYLQNITIFNIIEGLYADFGTNWYHDNQELAKQYWTPPLYPDIAVNELGYPTPEDLPNTTSDLGDSPSQAE